jgi:toxin ParE1/3/4
MTYRLTRRARRDLLNIWGYIAADNVSAADRFVDLLVHHFRIIGNFPEAGRKRDELRTGYRSLPVGEYLIFYRVQKPGVQIMHVVHGRMDLRRYRF